ncbi:2-oxoglutarate dehydrogenase complex dihydrolipoyllysine-residue succinyltransferase [Paenibacillus sp. IB182496]|uniref:Dihydrolipoyllysine-residue succinyltransferase component of 2-oxoglutarate dehydrogenase complex n=1 Tax=Paenibacillus sabuli TaxID=2772509 RepID=A0A927BSR2_9BACL|nr:2-oxoglutarate dehydrogenase complex dihydrolipoyllysine-residue succinyltransferase [Paenibacillus sabuli]MBD2846087.1 2-oxoglutarate dehydrogenase complex dihydrolipoyllysine-residue succinyltransferase [Paenibacillus sabuli]
MSDITIPDLGESITEGTISKWVKAAGDTVKRGDLLLELETDKVNLEVSAEDDGVLGEILKQEGDTVAPGEVVGTIGAGGGSAPAKAEEPAQEPSQPASQSQEEQPAKSEQSAKTEQPGQADKAAESGSVTATPAARRLAREQGIDLSSVGARDPLGRIRSDDVRQSKQAPAAAGQAPAPSQPAAAASAPEGKEVERRKMSRRRQTIAKRLVEAQHTAAMLTTFNEVDMTAIMELRKRRKDAFKEKHEVNLGFMSFFTKAVVGALKAFPLLNAEIDGDELLVKKYYDIGIAVSAKEGLVVPVVRDADRLSFAGIEKQILDLAGKARNNTLALSDLQGGTFTITNGGVFGSLLSTPILNSPQVGILGMHSIQRRPVATSEDGMENRPMMYIALSYDHRIVDGSEAVRFLVTIKNLLEDPESLLLEG